jgi:hypothetical protein
MKTKSIEEQTASHAQLALPEYLVFLILGNIKELRKHSPDHILVKAVEDVIDNPDIHEPVQYEMDLRTPLMQQQAD